MYTIHTPDFNTTPKELAAIAHTLALDPIIKGDKVLLSTNNHHNDTDIETHTRLTLFFCLGLQHQHKTP